MQTAILRLLHLCVLNLVYSHYANHHPIVSSVQHKIYAAGANKPETTCLEVRDLFFHHL